MESDAGTRFRLLVSLGLDGSVAGSSMLMVGTCITQNISRSSRQTSSESHRLMTW